MESITWRGPSPFYLEYHFFTIFNFYFFARYYCRFQLHIQEVITIIDTLRVAYAKGGSPGKNHAVVATAAVGSYTRGC